MANGPVLDKDTPAKHTRRELLNYAWLASLGMMVGGPISELLDQDSDPVNNPEGKFF